MTAENAHANTKPGSRRLLQETPYSPTARIPAPEEHVLQVDEQQWAAALVERYRVEAPVLDRAGVRMEQPEAAQVDVSWDTSRLIRLRPAYVPGHRTVVHIPYTGEEDIFHFLPSSHLMVELHA